MAKFFSLPDNEELVKLYADDVLRVCYFYLGKMGLAEDAFQEVFIKVIRKRDTFAGDCPPKYWLMAIAKNVCKDFLKSSWSTRISSFEQINEDSGEKSDFQRTSRRPDSKVYSDGHEQEDLIFDEMEPSGELWDAVNALPDVYKDVVLLKYYGNMDNAAIAKACDISESSVRSRLFRARKKLAKFERKNYMKGERLNESV